MPPSLVIRADANARIGFGHLGRCLALAEPWRKAGREVTLLTSSPSPGTQERAARLGISIRPLSSEPYSPQDADETASLGAKWTVLDGYQFSSETQRRFKETGGRMLVFDDGGRLDHYYGEFILNQNFGARAGMYENREPYTQILLGPKFAQLRGEFLKWRQSSRQTPIRARRLLVTTGGSDPDNVTATILRALRAEADLQITAVVGPENPHWEKLRSEFGDLRIIRDPPNFPELMRDSDLAVSAAGSTAWELAYLGVPLLAIVIAENQRSNAEHLDRAGLGRFVAIDAIRETVTQLAPDATARAAMSQKQRALFDGLGSLRVWLRMSTLR